VPPTFIAERLSGGFAADRTRAQSPCQASSTSQKQTIGASGRTPCVATFDVGAAGSRSTICAEKLFSRLKLSQETDKHFHPRQHVSVSVSQVNTLKSNTLCRLLFRACDRHIIKSGSCSPLRAASLSVVCIPTSYCGVVKRTGGEPDCGAMLGHLRVCYSFCSCVVRRNFLLFRLCVLKIKCK
jgi:hypothetical protein